MSEDYVVSVGARDINLVRTVLAGQDALRGMGQEFDKIGGRVRANTTSFDQMAAAIARNAAAFLGVGSAMAAISTASRLITAEYERFAQLKRNASDQGVSQGAAFEKAAISSGSREFIHKYGPIVARNYGSDRPEDSYRILGEVGSARDYRLGEAAAQAEAASAAVAAAKMTARSNDPELTALLGGSLQDLMKTLPAGDPRRNAEKLGGLAILMNAISRPGKPSSVAEHLIPIVAQTTKQYGGTISENMSLLGETTEGVVDVESGRRSGNAVIDALSDLRKHMASHPILKNQIDLQERFKRMTPDQMLSFAGGKGQEALMFRAYLLGATAHDKETADLARAMQWNTGAWTGEAKTILPMHALIDPGSPMKSKEGYEASKRFLEQNAGGAKAQESFNRYATMGPDAPEVLQQAELRARQRATIAELRMSDIYQRRAAAGHSLNFIDELGEIEGTGALEQRLRNLRALIKSGADTTDAVAETRLAIRQAQEAIGGRRFQRWYRNKHPAARSMFHRKELPAEARDNPEHYEEFLREEGSADERERYEALKRGDVEVQQFQKNRARPAPGDSSALRANTEALHRHSSALEQASSRSIHVEIDDTSGRVLRRAGDMPTAMEALSVG